VGSLQGLAPERVLHLGSVSKLLSPGVRIGWMLSPSWLSGALTYEQGVTGNAPAALDQLALAEFLTHGELDRHLRRMRLHYRRRRTVLVAEVARALPGSRVTGVAAGLYALVVLEPGTDEAALLRGAAERGVGVEGLSAHTPGAGPPGVVLGYAGLSEPEIERGIRALGDISLDRHITI
jgi:GntR family transcriptional regulator/MocR family aminotransferase